MNRTLTHFCLRCLAHPVIKCANDTAVIATDDVLGTTELAAIDVNSLPQQNALFYVGGYICKKYMSDLSDSSTIRFLQQTSCNSVSSAESGLTIPSGAFVSS